MTMPRQFAHATTVATLIVAALLAGCGTPAFRQVPPSVLAAPPVQVVAQQPTRYVGTEVLWGGVILRVTNHADSSEIELLGYPLDRRQRPLARQPQHGRFIAIFPGYLEAASFPEGRLLSVIGRVRGERSGVIGDSRYVWPEITVQQSHLWPLHDDKPRISLGLGVGVGL